MKLSDLFTSALGNIFRSKTRAILTILAIFVGAFTLTLTNGLGTGINSYIDDTVDAVGAPDVMTVTRAAETSSRFNGDGPVEYDPNRIPSGQAGSRGGAVTALTQDDLAKLSEVDGVTEASGVRTLTPDFIQADGSPAYVVAVANFVEGQSMQLVAGVEPKRNGQQPELVLPTTYVAALGFTDAEAAVGQTVTLQVTDFTGASHEIQAAITGVAEEALASPTGAGIVINDLLSDDLYHAQTIGQPSDQAEKFAQATIRFDSDISEDGVTALKERLADDGYTATTVADQLGVFTSVIDGIVLVLNAFAIIALLAAGFGIVNTLYMSVQERTREIGLMKAMGMGSGRVFTLFSLEAVLIGLLGSALGVGIGMLAGNGLSQTLADGLLSNLPGLTLIAFDPLAILSTMALIVGIAFLAGTLPAARAARAHPVESLRYE